MTDEEIKNVINVTMQKVAAVRNVSIQPNQKKAIIQAVLADVKPKEDIQNGTTMFADLPKEDVEYDSYLPRGDEDESFED